MMWRTWFAAETRDLWAVRTAFTLPWLAVIAGFLGAEALTTEPPTEGAARAWFGTAMGLGCLSCALLGWLAWPLSWQRLVAIAAVAIVMTLPTLELFQPEAPNELYSGLPISLSLTAMAAVCMVLLVWSLTRRLHVEGAWDYTDSVTPAAAFGLGLAIAVTYAAFIALGNVEETAEQIRAEQEGEEIPFVGPIMLGLLLLAAAIRRR